MMPMVDVTALAPGSHLGIPLSQWDLAIVLPLGSHLPRLQACRSQELAFCPVFLGPDMGASTEKVATEHQQMRDHGLLPWNNLPFVNVHT